MNVRTHEIVVGVLLVVLAVGGAGCVSDGQAGGPTTGQAISVAGQVAWPITECGTYSGEGCAPTDERVDMARPKFSKPTEITNPLFPIGRLASAVLLGTVDGLAFRSETTLLQEPGTVMWDGQPVQVLVSQYTAYLDGRITEVAIDRYAQADDGSVWYFGEDVYDYEDGTVFVTEGTWLAGRDGPPAMIMPAHPAVGDVFRTENIPGVVFEEVRVIAVDQTVDGPYGKVSGAMIGEELHLDGSTSQKVFAPGYGEYYTASGGEVEALSIASPSDASNDVAPPELKRLLTAAWGLVESARLEEWVAVAAAFDRIGADWGVLRDVAPPLVADRMEEVIGNLEEAVRDEDASAAVQAAVEVAQSALDVAIRFWTVAAVDSARFNLHTQQLRAFAADGDIGGVAGEVALLEWIHQRILGSIPGESQVATVDLLGSLRSASNARNLEAAADIAARLGVMVLGGTFGTN
jgi:hypothetical protein